MPEAKRTQPQPDEYEVLLKLKAELEEYKTACGQMDSLQSRLEATKKELAELQRQKSEIMYDLIDMTQARKKIGEDDPSALFMRLLRKAVKPLWEAKAEMEYCLARMGEPTPKQAREMEKSRDLLKSLVDMLNQKF